jgi:adenylate cyclase, class 2
MASNQEVEVKFRVGSLRLLDRKLRSAGFRKQTPRTREVNALYDLPGAKLRKRKELLRLRHYGNDWKLTHKSGGKTGRHSSRQELETKVSDGKKMDAILRSLDYEPSFRYEKFRSEWSDHKGEVVVDETPIGNFAEIEGPPRWIDQTARKLDVSRDQYIMKNYATLFNEWKRQTNSRAEEMTFRAIRRKKR